MTNLPQNLKDKLFSIVSKPRAILNHKQVIQIVELKEISLNELFPKGESVRVLELGTGFGEHVVSFAQANPKSQIVAIEVKLDRIYKTLKQMDRLKIENVRFLALNMNWFFTELLPPSSFDVVIINFPDPWPKRRHWKHRLINAEFPPQLHRILRSEGVVRIATDYGPYARKILRTFRDSPLFSKGFPETEYQRERPAGWFPTHFETIHLQQGKRPYYMEFRGNYAEGSPN